MIVNDNQRTMGHIFVFNLEIWNPNETVGIPSLSNICGEVAVPCHLNSPSLVRICNLNNGSAEILKNRSPGFIDIELTSPNQFHW